MTTKLALMNNALLELGQRPLSDTGEAVEAGRVLSQVYQNVVNECLSMGSWNFATETIEATADTGVTPNFGYTEVFAKPSNWLRTVAVSDDEYFSSPLLRYYDDVSYWSADVSPIYVRYVSNDTGMGFDLAKWPPSFTRFVELELADRVCPRVASGEKSRVYETREKARRRALNEDAMNEPNPKFPPPGGWTLARGGGSGGGDRGKRGSLIG